MSSNLIKKSVSFSLNTKPKNREDKKNTIIKDKKRIGNEFLESHNGDTHKGINPNSCSNNRVQDYFVNYKEQERPGPKLSFFKRSVDEIGDVDLFSHDIPEEEKKSCLKKSSIENTSIRRHSAEDLTKYKEAILALRKQSVSNN